MDRRRFLTVLAAGTAAILSACEARPSADRRSPATGGAGSEGTPTQAGAADSTATAAAVQVPATPTAGVSRLPPQTPAAPPVPDPQTLGPAVPTAIIDRLPAGSGPRLALTVDDGTSTAVLDAYVDFINASGIRLTFFVNGVYRSWTAVQPKLAPLVESGQVQLGNHTWSHPSITGLSDSEIVDQLDRNERFLRRTYGVDGRPYFRPPYGHRNHATDRLTGGLGYDRTAMWFGTLADASVVTPSQVLAAARTWFRPRQIVIGHANHPAVTHVYPQLVELIRDRALQTVTLRDVFGDEPLTAPNATPPSTARPTPPSSSRSTASGSPRPTASN